MRKEIIITKERTRPREFKKIRRNSGLSQVKFGEKYGIPVPTIEAWERGTRRPPEYVLNLLAFRVAYDIGVSEEELRAIASGIL